MRGSYGYHCLAKRCFFSEEDHDHDDDDAKISCRHKIFLRRRENFLAARKFQKKLGRRDRFRPKIVEIGVILAIFKPFEVLKIHMPLFGEFSWSSQDLCESDNDSHKSRDDRLNSLKSGISNFLGWRSDNVMIWWYDDNMIIWWWNDNMIIW